MQQKTPAKRVACFSFHHAPFVLLPEHLGWCTACRSPYKTRRKIRMVIQPSGNLTVQPKMPWKRELTHKLAALYLAGDPLILNDNLAVRALLW